MTTPNEKVIDLDAELGFEDEPELKTKRVKLFGREWDFLESFNSYNLSAVFTGDPGAVAKFMSNTVVPDQRADFANAIAARPDLDTDKLLELFNKIVEAVTGRPTNKPARSSRTASKRTSSPRSAAH